MITNAKFATKYNLCCLVNKKNTKCMIWYITFIYKYKYVWVDKKGQEQIQIYFGWQKGRITIQTRFSAWYSRYEYDYKYSSHTGDRGSASKDEMPQKKMK